VVDDGDATDRHQLRVVELGGISEHRAVADMLGGIWRVEPTHVISAELLRAFAHSGNYVVGAYIAGGVVGSSVALFGQGQRHSNITGGDHRVHGGGVGVARMAPQRSWARARGIAEIHWTFDPLVRRNAHFNINKLGATATEYLPEFYGPMTDGINAGDESDRLYVVWDLADEVDGRPATNDGEPEAEPVLVATPADIETLRHRDPAAAAAWRVSVRSALTGAMAAGYRITGIRRDGHYVLARS
jgi:predicted GNAT superfamily acetyltransferase